MPVDNLNLEDTIAQHQEKLNKVEKDIAKAIGHYGGTAQGFIVRLLWEVCKLMLEYVDIDFTTNIKHPESALKIHRNFIATLKGEDPPPVYIVDILRYIEDVEEKMKGRNTEEMIKLIQAIRTQISSLTEFMEKHKQLINMCSEEWWEGKNTNEGNL